MPHVGLAILGGWGIAVSIYLLGKGLEALAEYIAPAKADGKGALSEPRGSDGSRFLGKSTPKAAPSAPPLVLPLYTAPNAA